ncbi:MAG: N-methyl-L-tryptophan oxidase [Candidatus Obscuribacterales bacterium]|nr:N-methyl-L-tryptophan oxidase [Candidatus Obscuribacterales bacterium]
MSALKVAVAGLGIHGASAAYELQKRGCRVLGFDLHPPLHKQGSSHGRSRIIRLAYSESPHYVVLLQEAYKRWHDLAKKARRKLLRQTGGLIFGPRDGHLVSGALKSAQQFSLEHEYLSAAEVNRKFPGFSLPESLEAFYESAAGILDAEACVASYLKLAQLGGADLHHEEPVLSYEKEGSGIRIKTSKSSYLVDKLLLTTGPWASEFLADLKLPLQVVRQLVVHCQPSKRCVFNAKHFPVYYYEVSEGCYYGFPQLPGQGVKFGRHDVGQACTARNIKRSIDTAEVEALRSVINKYMPGSCDGKVLRSYTCMYTNTPDRDFVVGLHPDNANIVFGSWCGGHGFKFGSVSGKIHADLLIQGKTDMPIDFLSLARFA